MRKHEYDGETFTRIRPKNRRNFQADEASMDASFAEYAARNWPGATAGASDPAAYGDGTDQYDGEQYGDAQDDGDAAWDGQSSDGQSYDDQSSDDQPWDDQSSVDQFSVDQTDGEYRPFDPENPEGLPGDRWTTWDDSTAGERGPEPRPAWVVTELGARDTEFGILKTGKEADVFLLERAVPGTDRRTLMAAKRYRDSQHRMFHRDSGYLEGRRDKESRVNRAMAKRTAFGRQAIAAQWAAAEFGALCRLWEAGAAVPYPVQILGTEILMEFIGDDEGAAAPRLAQLRPEPELLESLWSQLYDCLSVLARDGFAHGDLSAYNLLVHEERLVMIDVPQVVDVIANPRGAEFLARDVRNVGNWFVSRGLMESRVGELTQLLVEDAGLA